MQTVTELSSGQFIIEGDWYPKTLPANVVLDKTAYPDTSYSFTTCYSQKAVGFKLGYGSGNYGHGIFTSGVAGEILIGEYVVLQCTRILSNYSVTIDDHSMVSWGAVITDSWITKKMV